MKNLFLLPCFIILTFFGCSRLQNRTPDFVYNDSAFIKLTVKNCSDTTEFFFKTSPMFPRGCVIKKIYPTHDTICYFSHKTTKPDFIELGFRIKFQTYVIPGDTLKIIANLDPNVDDTDAIHIDGELGEIMDFFSIRHERFENWHIIYALANLYDTKYPIEKAFLLCDSICSTELEFLNSYNLKNRLPHWFYETFKADIEYNRALVRPQLFMVRDYFFKEKTDNPETYYIFNQIKLYNPKAKFSDYYYQCIDTYLWVNHQQDLVGKHGIDRVLPLFERSIPEAKQILKGEILEYYLAWKTSELFAVCRNINDYTRIDSLYSDLKNQIENDELIKILDCRRNYVADYFKEVSKSPFIYTKIIPDDK